MSGIRSFPPEWQPVALNCPKCPAGLEARYSPNTGALEALRCKRCPWSENYVLVAKNRKARIDAARKKFPRSVDLQQRLDTKGDTPNGH